MDIRKLFLFFFIFLATKAASSQGVQRFNSFLFRVNDGMLQSSIRDMAIDKNNYCWISYPNGIQTFDGVDFKTVQIQTGLPDDKWVDFQELPSGDLLISHSKGISIYQVKTNSFKLVVKWLYPINMPMLFLGYHQGVVYLFDGKNEVLGFNMEYKLISRKKVLPKYSEGTIINFTIHPAIKNGCIIGSVGSKLCKWRIKDMEMVNMSEDLGKGFLAYIGVSQQGDAFYCNYGSDSLHFFIYQFNIKKSKYLFHHIKKPVLPFRANVNVWFGKQLFSINDKVFELDSLTLKPKSELADFHRESFTNNGAINQFVADRFGNLYLQSVTTGICKVAYNNLPIKYYGNYKSKGNYILTVFADKAANRILVGSVNSGLFIYDTSQQLIKHWPHFPGWPNSTATNQIVKSPDGGYYIFSFACPYIYYLSSNLKTIQQVKLHIEGDKNEYIYPGYFANPLFQNNSIAILQTQHIVFNINFSKKEIRIRNLPWKEISSGLYRSPYIIVARSDSLIFLDAVSLRQEKAVYFPNTGGVRCYKNASESAFFVGTNKGVFQVSNSGTILAHWDKNSGIPDECIYSMELDSQGGLWCGSNRGIFRIGPQKSILQLTSDDGLQENEFNSNASFTASDGEMFFAGVNGVSAFYPSSILKRNDPLRTIFTSVRINDVPVKNESFSEIRELNLPYHKNALSFDFHAMSAGNPSQYVYQYRMIGFDKNWIQNSGMQTVRYFLAPGKYKFQVYTSRAFNCNAIAQREIDIVINPQFWQTWWFIFIVAVFLFSIAGYIFNLIFRSRFEKQMLRLQAEQKVQKERERISRDLHDNIGAYANTVLYKTQIMENDESDKKEILDDLKYASKEIITSLRETIWALKNENFTAQDCLIRIRNFTQSLNKFYPKINFKVVGDAPPNQVIHSAKALNLVRIIQEGATNSIKHSLCRQILVTSKFDLHNWELVIEDDGTGFDVEKEMKNDEGNGLKHMMDRASESGMHFSLTSQPGRGTRVLLRLNI